MSVVTTWRADPAAAAEVLDECIALMRDGAAGVTYGHILATRSVISAIAGERSAALHQLRDALRFSHDKGDFPMLSVVFGYGLQVLETLDADEDATFFAGCARSPLMSMVSNLPLEESANRDRAVETLRERTGAVGFDAAVADAAQLPVDDAVAEAMRRLDHLIAVDAQ